MKQLNPGSSVGSDEITNILRRSGLRITPQRYLMIKLITESSGHFTAEEIYGRIKREFPNVSLATVYSMIRVLNSLGITREVAHIHHTGHIELNREPHINIVCEKCGKIDDYFDDDVAKILQRIEKSRGTKVKKFALDVYVDCEDCEKGS